MKSILFFLAAVCTLPAADVAGSWRFCFFNLGEEGVPARMELKVEGTKLTGNLAEIKLEGAVEDGALKFTATRPNGNLFAAFEGHVDASGNEIKGQSKFGGENVAWVARRAAPAGGPPRTHTFEPAQFEHVFSGAIAPAARIHPGDTVRTTTVDSGGRDAQGTQRSRGGNPETGPFYVEGAMPGDTLVVRLNRLRLNRDSARSGDRITGDALQASYLQSVKFDPAFSSRWKLDREQNVAVLASPSEHLKNFKVPLQPMLGCVGVAPPDKQAFRSGWLGAWGGNMDYNGLREGVALYLPVFQEGALLFLGDGHAAQGDGELNGDALETSMDVEFTVDLIRDRATAGPRAESADAIMAMGIANSLPDALKLATTQLARWIEQEYHLTANESAIVLGTSVRYDIAEVVDPQVNVVARLAKSVLAQLR